MNHAVPYDRYENMRHPRVFRVTDWLFDCLGLKGIGIRRLDWLRRLQWWAGASDYQYRCHRGDSL